jgi:hypothetical protein
MVGLKVVSSDTIGQNNPRLCTLKPIVCFRRNPRLIVERSASDDSKQPFEAGRLSRLSIKPCSAVHTNAPLLHATVARGDAAKYQMRLVFSGRLKSIRLNGDAHRERAPRRTLTVRAMAGVDEDWLPRDLVANGTTQTATTQRYLHQTISLAFHRRMIEWTIAPCNRKTLWPELTNGVIL